VILEGPGSVRVWFEGVLAENYRLLFTVAWRVVRNERDAEDVVQEAILKGFKSLDRLREAAQAAGWLCRIVHSTALDAVRRRVVERAEVERRRNAGGARTEADEEAAARDDVRLVLEELDRLPQSQALVVTLRFLDGLEIPEISRRLGVSDNTARVRLHRALVQLRGRVVRRARTPRSRPDRMERKR